MINMLIIPFAFILLVLVLFILRKNMHQILRPSLRGGLFFFYFGVLVMLTVLFFYLQPKLQVSEPAKTDHFFLKDFLYHEERLDQLDPYLNEQWRLAIEDKTIRLQAMFAGYSFNNSIPVVIFEDDSLDKEAAVFHYETPAQLNGVDLSEYIQPPHVEVAENTVIVKISGYMYEYELFSIRNNSFLQQFEAQNEHIPFFDIQIGETALLIHVPKGTTVLANPDQFELINQ